jgi:small subunit ribosomal protein S3
MGAKISVELLRAKTRLKNVANNSAAPNDLQKSVWFASGKSYSKLLLQDLRIRKYLFKKLSFAGLAQVVIRRNYKRTEITLFVTKPGVVIGKGGASINELKADLIKRFKLAQDLRLEIQEFKDPFRSAQVIAFEISEALKRSVPYRRLAKNYTEKIKYAGVLGAKISLKGRLNGAEIARKEEFAVGSIPRHTIDSSIDYAHIQSHTKAGVIGVRVWIYTGDKLKNYTY